MINKFYAEVKKYIKENYKFLICLILIIVVFEYKNRRHFSPPKMEGSF